MTNSNVLRESTPLNIKKGMDRFHFFENDSFVFKTIVFDIVFVNNPFLTTVNNGPFNDC